MNTIVFAYGSNMDSNQMRSRCPGAKVVGIGELKGYRLCFPRWSENRRHAVASVESMAGESVWGVLFEISDADLRSLDRHEAFRAPGDPKNGYRREEVALHSAGAEIRAKTYFAEVNPKHPEPGQPNAGYLKQIVNGAVGHGLPEVYVSCLLAIKTSG